MTKETFVSRLKKIKELEETLNKNHNLMVEGNPFVEDGGGVIPSWLMNLIFEHVLTLFAAVNEDALYRTKLEECQSNHPEKSLEEIAELIGISVNKLKTDNENVYVLTDLAEYFLYEMNWGGLIELEDGTQYDFSDYGRLYDYLREEV